MQRFKVAAALKSSRGWVAITGPAAVMVTMAMANAVGSATLVALTWQLPAVGPAVKVAVLEGPAEMLPVALPGITVQVAF